MKNIVEQIILLSKWMLIPFYFGLMASLGIFAYVNFIEVFRFIHETLYLEIDESSIRIILGLILNLIDLTMIATLMKMIIIGSYTSFNEKLIKVDDPNAKTSSGVLKVKIATTLIGLASINLLEMFLRDSIDVGQLKIKLVIFCAFLAGALVLSIIDILHVKAEVIHQEDKDKDKKH